MRRTLSHSLRFEMVGFAFVFLCSTAAIADDPEFNPNQYPPPGMLVDLGGWRLHLHCTGTDRPAVVFVPGSGDFSFDWSLVQPEVARFTRSCSYDRAGSAWSDPGPLPRTMRQEAYELHSLLQKAGVEGPYVLVGHSYGGLVVRRYAQLYPDEVAGMVLEEMAEMHAGRGWPEHPLGDKPVKVIIPSNRVEAPPGISAEEWTKLAEEKVRQKESLARLSRNSEVVAAPRSGHHVMLDEPDVVVQAVREVVEASRGHYRLDLPGAKERPGGQDRPGRGAASSSPVHSQRIGAILSKA